MEFRILGPLEVHDAGRAITVAGAKQRALLAILLLRANEVVSTDTLIDLLWSERPPKTAAHTLQVFVSDLRKALKPGGAKLVTRAPGYAIEIDPDQLDANRFERVAREGREALAAGSPELAARRFEEALALWRGQPLADFAYEAFAQDELGRFEELRLGTLEERIDAELQLGHQADVLGELLKLVAEHPLRERLRGQLMLALYRSDRQAEALDAYQEARRILVEELGLEPSAALQRLQQQLLSQDPALEPPLRAEREPAVAPTEEPEPAEAPSREERKVITSLFCDLVGSTARTEQLDPEDVRTLLSGYHARVKGELERFGGTVEKFVGDAVMALFGAPTAHEDDPERAVRAALAVCDWAREEGDLQVRIGITTGEALVSLATRPDAGEGMAWGDVVSTAARLQTAAPVDGVLVDETTYRATRHTIELAEREAISAKGKVEPIPVWEALQARARLGIDVVQRARTSLVGREHELEVLLAAFARARQERSTQLVTIVGVPGIGKSRLVFELFSAVESVPELIAWRQGRSLPYGEGVSFWALGEVIKAQAGILETDDADAAAQKVSAAVGNVMGDSSEAAWVESRLRPLVGIGEELELGRDRRGEAFAAWRRFFEAVAEQTPLVLVFEDLHWADEGVLDFIDHLVEWAGAASVLVVCLGRPELLTRRPAWGGGKPNAATISLAPLTEEDTGRLVSSLLEQAVLPAETQLGLLARAGGNPLYAEEYVEMLRDRGFLYRDGSVWRLDDAQELPIPDTVQALIAARVDALPLDQKMLIQDAAVQGTVFWVGALAASGDPEAAVSERLHALERKEFIRRERRSAVAGEEQYAFRHVLVRDIAYGQISRVERVEKHRRAAEWIASLAPDRSEDRSEMLAHHYVSALDYARVSRADTGQLAERARNALAEAGDRAFALNAFPTAARFYEAAVDLWPVDDQGRPQLLFRYGRAQFYAAEAGSEALQEARDALLAAGDRETGAEAETMLALLLSLRGDRGRAFECLRRAAQMVADAPPSRAKVVVLSNLAASSMRSGENEETIRLGREALEMANELGLDELRAQALNFVGVARSTTGDLGGMADLEESIATAERINSSASIRGYLNLASIAADLGDLTRSFELQAEGRRAAARFGDSSFIRWLRVEQAAEHYQSGCWDESLRLADSFISEVEAGSTHYLEPICRSVRGHICLGRGQITKGVDDSERALSFARQTNDTQLLCPALAFCARALLAAARPGESGEHATELMALAGAGEAVLTSGWVEDLAVALTSLGRADELETWAAARTPTRWLEAAHAFATGELEEAAALYGEIGSLPAEAFARLWAAESLISGGRRRDGEIQLAHALGFFRDVGATAYVQRGEVLLSASA